MRAVLFLFVLCGLVSGCQRDVSSGSPASGNPAGRGRELGFTVNR
jgi:hypothetical protein